MMRLMSECERYITSGELPLSVPDIGRLSGKLIDHRQFQATNRVEHRRLCKSNFVMVLLFNSAAVCVTSGDELRVCASRVPR